MGQNRQNLKHESDQSSFFFREPELRSLILETDSLAESANFLGEASYGGRTTMLQ